MAKVHHSEIVRLGFPRQPAMQPALAPAVLSREQFAGLRFVHHWTGVGKSDAEERPHGTTVWVAGTPSGECAALGFDWQELPGGVLCVVDPFGITSNAYPVNGSGESVDASERLRMLMMAVHALQWQQRIREHLPRARSSETA